MRGEEMAGVDLGEQLSIASVAALRAEWMDRIASGLDEHSLLLQGEGVQSVDTAGLQLLLSLIRGLEKEGVEWRWGGASQPLHESARQLGLSALLTL